MLGKRKHTVGLYIGSQKTVMARLQRVGNQFTVEHLSVADTPSDAFDEEGIVNVPSFSRLIRDQMSESDVKSQDVSLAIPTRQGVIIRSITMPSMAKKEMREALSSEVENYAPLSSSEPVLDFQVTGQVFEGTSQKVVLLLVAAPKSLVRSYVASLEAANLKTSAIEPLSHAILRTITLTPNGDESGNGEPKPEDGSSVMTVCLEENDGMVTISRGHSIHFVHSIEFGRIHLDNDKVFGELAGEIKSSITYYQTAFSEYNVDKILLFVNSEDSTSICAKLSEFLDIPVTIPPLPEVADELTKSTLESNSLSAYAAIGTAMYTKGDGVINLLPSRSIGIGAIDLRKQVLAGALSMFLAALLSTGVMFGLRAWTGAVVKKTESVKQQRENYREGIAISGAENEAVQLRSQLNLANNTLNTISVVKWVEVLPELRNIIPKNIWLSSLMWQENNNVTLVGNSLSYESVFRFIDTLKDSPYFVYPQLTHIRRSKIGEASLMQFELRCGLKSGKLGGQEVKIGVS
jgi:Tfp pilus assembly PilM family ATPase/Tfp pilus assembly protein PilN